MGRTHSDVREIGGDDAVMTLVADVFNHDDVEKAVGRIVAETGRPDILIDNAGTNPKNVGFVSGSRTSF